MKFKLSNGSPSGTKTQRTSYGSQAVLRQANLGKIHKQWRIGHCTSIDVCDMDETAVFFETPPRFTVHYIDSQTASISSIEKNNVRLTVFLSIPYDGTKLPLFLVFRCKANARIENILNYILPDHIFGSCQGKGWIDERSMRLCLEKL